MLGNLIPSIEATNSISPALLYMLAAMTTGFVVSWGSGILLIRVLKRLGIQEKTEKTPIEDDALRSKICRKSGTPTMGGLMIGLGIAAAVLLWSDLANKTVLLTVLCFASLAVVGIIDDALKIKISSREKRGLKLRYKLPLQIAIGVTLGLIYRASATQTHADPGYPFATFHALLIRWWPVWAVISGVVIATMSNAVNVTDGVDGLAATLSFLAFLALACILSLQTLLQNHVVSHTAVLSIGIAGATLGFLCHNRNPARVFMGDTGSLAIGGSLGFIVLISGIEMLLPLIGFIFLIEFFSSVLQVIYFHTTGRRLLPIAPVHHICELRKWSDNQIVTRMTAIAIVPTMIALVLII